MSHSNRIASRNQAICLIELDRYGVDIHIKREDEIHPVVSGNKWRKLKYHILVAQTKNARGVLTFGGAFSNHIAATAFAAHESGLQSIGIIRGERVGPLNPTLSEAESKGMELHFVSRSEYRTDKKALAASIDSSNKFHHIPEGGADELGLQGCLEILSEDDRTDFDIIACPSGTGTTAAGLFSSLGAGQCLRVYPALKGDFARNDIEALLKNSTDEVSLQIVSDYHFGGYAKTKSQLFEFMRWFHFETGIRTDPIYTAKMLYGLIEDIKKGRICKGSRILAIHTGGLQGIQGIELRDDVRIFAQDRSDN